MHWSSRLCLSLLKLSQAVHQNCHKPLSLYFQVILRIEAQALSRQSWKEKSVCERDADKQAFKEAVDGSSGLWRPIIPPLLSFLPIHNG